MIVSARPRSRRAVLTSALLAPALLLPLLAASPASAATEAAAEAAASSPACRPPVTTVGALSFRWLPAGLGARWDGPEYSIDDVDFDAAVWESGSDEVGWTVDLHVTVMTGARLTTARALHDWFIDHQQRPADEVDYRRTTVRGAPGWITRDQIFWLVRPGLAASVTLRLPRWTTADLRRLVNAYAVSS